MAEPSTKDFEGLRNLLEGTAVQPSFRDLSRRRLQRTQMSALAAVAAGLALVMTGALLAPRPATRVAPVDPVPSSTAVPGGDSFWSPPIAPVGVGSTVVALADACDPACAARRGETRRVLIASDDAGRTWRIQSPPTWSLSDATLIADDRDLWMWFPTMGQVAYSSNAGGTWTVADGGPTGGSESRVWAGDGVLWVDATDGLYRFDRARDTRRASRPAAGEIMLIVPIDADHALAAVTASPPNGQLLNIDWYVTADRGASWIAVVSPCTASPVPQPYRVAGTRAPDGSLWVACSGLPHDLRSRNVVMVSTDQGLSWRATADAEEFGVVTHITAFSATEAWRWGDRTSVYRTEDATQWTDVGITTEPPGFVLPLVGGTAVTNDRNGLGVRVLVTNDGGRTWQSYPITMP